MHIDRQKIISNKSLLHNASRVGLPPYIQAKPFTFKVWQPPNFQIVAPPIQPKGSKKTDTEDKGDEQGGTESADLTEKKDPPINGESGVNVESTPQDLQEPPVTALEAPVQDSTVEPQTSTLDEQTEQTETSQAVNPPLPTDGPKPRKRTKKKKQQDELYSQWLGDKVTEFMTPTEHMPQTEYLTPPLGCSGCCRSHHWRCIYFRRSGNGIEGYKSAEYSRSSY